MTVYELRNKTLETEPHYFDYETLKFFGESMSTMNILKGTTIITDYMGEKHECVTLSKLSRKYPGGARRTYDYFDIQTWERVLPN